MMFETDALYQNDPRWKDINLGNQSKETIGTWGCLVTSLTMVANGYGCNETPETINEKMKAAGGFQGALIIPAKLPAVCPGLVYKGYQSCEDSPAPITQIDAAIASGKPVIVQVDWSPRAGLQTHWVVIYDKEGDDYYMKDPYRYRGDAPDKKIKLLDRYTYSGRDITKAITGVIWFEGTTPPQPKPEVPIPDDSFTVYATVDGLAFRNDAAVTAELIKRLPLNASLATLESKAEADAKIGVYGQWIQVQDSAGDQGYTAAWYVSKTVAEEEAKPPEPQPPTIPPDDIEFYLIPIADGLAVRSAPDYNAELIKRVPLGTQFGYFESQEEVSRKVGIRGQWIHVYDDSGLQGYTAAWYLTRKAGKPPAPPSDVPLPPEPEPPTDPEPPIPPEPPVPPEPVKGLAVVPTIGGLAFRSQPYVSDATLLKRLTLNAILTVEEVEEQAKHKIGIQGQWIKVKDTSGETGYVAAWYVKIAAESDPGEGTEETPEGLALRTTTEGVALRRAPVIADHTLIKRLPNNARVVALDANTASKIGVYGQWIKIRDSSGTEGYLAAWYVERD